MPLIRRIFADGRTVGAGTFSDAVIIQTGRAWLVRLAGIASHDPVTGAVAGYEPHNATYAPDALEQQVADVFAQAERLLAAAGDEIGVPVTLADLTEAVAYLRDDHPGAFRRFDDAYAAEFARRGIGDYPARTTVLGVRLPAPNALVEVRFEAAVAAPRTGAGK